MNSSGPCVIHFPHIRCVLTWCGGRPYSSMSSCGHTFGLIFFGTRWMTSDFPFHEALSSQCFGPSGCFWDIFFGAGGIDAGIPVYSLHQHWVRIHLERAHIHKPTHRASIKYTHAYTLTDTHTYRHWAWNTHTHRVYMKHTYTQTSSQRHIHPQTRMNTYPQTQMLLYISFPQSQSQCKLNCCCLVSGAGLL